MKTPKYTPEEDISIFQQEAARKKYPHALFHLACAISCYPQQEEWLQLADQLWKQHQNEVFRFFDKMHSKQRQYYAVIALHSYFLWKAGKYNEAVSQLTLVINAAENSYYFPWIANWLTSLNNVSLLEPENICRVIAGCMNQIDFYANNTDPEIYETLLKFAQALSENSNLPFEKSLLVSMLCRRLHRYDEALAAAKKGFEKNPTAINANFIALCYKEMDQIPEMEEYTKLSISINPSERSICNDMGDVFVAHKNYQKAAEYYALAMEVGPDEWAEPSYYYCKYQLQEKDSIEMLKKLIVYMERNKENIRAKDLYHQIESQLYPEREWFYDKIHYSQESLVNLLHQISESYVKEYGSRLNSFTAEGSHPFRSAVSCLESPSAVNAFCLYLSDYGRKTADYTLLCKKEPDPPFLEPVEEPGVSGTFRLWDYDETYHFTPTVKPAGEAVSNLVLELATEDYSLTHWYRKATELAKKLPTACRKELEGIFVYPPRCPNEDYPMDGWLMRIQYAAVFLLAALDEKESLLPSPSLKRILFGQLDWPVLPALTVLSYQTKLYESCFKEVYRLFQDFEKRIFRDSFCYFSFTFLVAVLNLNGLSKQEFDTYKGQLYAITLRNEKEEEEEVNEEELKELKDMLNE